MSFKHSTHKIRIYRKTYMKIIMQHNYFTLTTQGAHMNYTVSFTLLLQSHWQVISLSGYIMTLALTDEKERLTCVMFQHGSHSFKFLAKDQMCPAGPGYREPRSSDLQRRVLTTRPTRQDLHGVGTNTYKLLYRPTFYFIISFHCRFN